MSPRGPGSVRQLRANHRARWETSVFDDHSPTLIRVTRALFNPVLGARRRLRMRFLSTLARRQAPGMQRAAPPMSEEDAVFVGFLSLSSALGFLLVVLVSVTPVVDARPLSELPDRFVNLALPAAPPPPPDALDAPLEDDTLAAPKPVAPSPEAPPEGAPGEAAEPPAGAPAAPRPEDEVQRSSLLAALTGTLGDHNSGQRVRDLFDEEDVGAADLDRLLSEVDGVRVASATPSGPRLARGGQGRAEIGDPEVAPTVSIDDSMRLPSSGDDEAVRQVIRGYLGQIRACYERGLKGSPDLQGRLVAEFSVAGGRVQQAWTTWNDTGSDELAECVTRQILRWRFEASTEAEIAWPLVFSR
jgi:hypothetical protein